MTLWKLTLAYDGTPYRGWQVQPSHPTVQGTLADALCRITGERVLPQGSGRTDTGVHALGQVASFALAAPIPAANLHRALNRCLPPSIRVLTADVAPHGFHARHSAVRKTYEYRIFPLREALQPKADHRAPSLRQPHEEIEHRICPPELAPFVWPCPWPLDLEALNQAARHILGTHDFTSFAATDRDQTTRNANVEFGHAEASASCPPPIRTLYSSEWHADRGLLIYRVTGSGFLHHMVRNLVGTFVQAGAHRIAADSIPALLYARNRAVSGATAPATGLFLVGVEYPESHSFAPVNCNLLPDL
jgi:tRNA pseudouridine38-40 synthase